MKKLYKVEDGKKIFGVCGGLAEYFNLDVTLVRLATVILALCWGSGLLAYFLAALILPKKEDVV